MQDGRDNRIHIDENGDRWLTDKNGNLLRDERGNKITPQQSEPISKPGEFTLYDNSRGHCALCGSLNCIGNCFK